MDVGNPYRIIMDGVPTIQTVGPLEFSLHGCCLRRLRNFARFCFRCYHHVGPTRNDLSNTVLLPGIAFWVVHCYKGASPENGPQESPVNSVSRT
jgi:hypothetical protein